MTQRCPNILLLQLEFPTWATARPWTYSANFAVADALAAAGADCFTVPILADQPTAHAASWFSHARRLLTGKRFDQVWVWLVHTPFDQASLEWIADLAPVRVGVVMESLTYEADDYAWAPELKSRQAMVEEQIRHMTHVLLPDERDAERLARHPSVRALWWPLFVPERVITVPGATPIHRRGVFHGSPYGPRREWIQHPRLKDCLTFAKPASPPTMNQQLFDQLQQAAAQFLRSGSPAEEKHFRQYVDKLREIRSAEFGEWMAGLPQWAALVNLPTLARFYGGRVLEGMAAGRPVLSWSIADRPKNGALFEDGRDIFLFPKHDPDALAGTMERVLNDAGFARRIAHRARHKLQQYHTAEHRIAQTLDWIESGREPDYGLVGHSTIDTPSGAPAPHNHDSPAASLSSAKSPRARSTGPGSHRAPASTESEDIPRTTVFILTVGDPAFEACLASVKNQTGTGHRLDIIRDVSPFSAAAQEMITRCATPYFIQVDEDMMLAPDAVATMEAVMDEAPEAVGMICFHLYDEDRGINIQGVKIYRTALMRGLSFQDLKASEMDLLDQMGQRGIQWILHPDVKGRHGTLYTPETIYRRYKTMYEKDIRQWNILTDDLRHKADRFKETGDPLQLFALLGAAHGIIHAPQAENREKDSRAYDLPELRVFKRLLAENPPNVQPYDPRQSGTPVRHAPIPLHAVAWKNRRERLQTASDAVTAPPPHTAAETSPARPGPPRSILIVTPFFWPSVGGVERVVEHLGVGLIERGYAIDVAAYPSDGRTSQVYRGINIITVANHDQFVQDMPVCTFQVERLIASGRYAACLLIGAPSNALFYGALTRSLPTGMKLIMQPTMNRETYEHLQSNEHVASLFVELAKRSDAVVVLSENGHDARFAREHGVAVTYIPNGTEVTTSKLAFRQTHGISNDAFVVLHVANLYQVKNHLGLLQALPRLPEGARLVVIGYPTSETAYVQEVRQAFAARPDVLYIPGLPPEDVAAAMQAADLFVLSSHAEASPLSILEAMSHGLPWLTTPECGAVHEMAGGLVAPLSEFRRTIEVLMAHPDFRRELGAAGQAHWSASFRPEMVLQGWVDLIERGRLDKSFTMPVDIQEQNNALRTAFTAYAAEAAAGPDAAPSQRIPTSKPPDHQEAVSPAHRQGELMDADRFYVNLFVKEPAWSTPHPNTDESARWVKIAAFLEYITRHMQRIEPARQLRILEVGCGRGWLTNLASKYGRCEGVEPVAGVVEHARRLFPHLTFSAGTAETILERPDFSPYDILLCSEVIEHVPDAEKGVFVAQLAKLLKADGFLIMSTPRGEMWNQWKTIAPPNQPVEDWVTEERLRDLFTTNGFRELGLERIHVELPRLRYIPTPTPADLQTMNLAPIYQVWACQRTGGLASPVFTRPPAVSVIVPTYNRPDRLREALASIAAQTFLDFEIVVVNDGTDDVSAVIQEFNRRHSITLITHDRNRGLAAARNTGLRAARGTYVAYLDDDDRYLPDHLETLVTFLRSHDCKVAYTDAWRVHETLVDGRYIERGRDLPYSHDFNPANLLVSNFFPVLCVMHERACLEDVGLFDESLFAHEDWDLWIRMATKYPFQHIKHTTAEFTWRTDGSSMTSGSREIYWRTTDIIYRKYQPYAQQSREIVSAQQQQLQKVRAEIEKQARPKTYDCSIIIPVFNKMELTAQCLTALAKVTEQADYEVVLVDNGSSDGTGAFLRQLGGDVRIITNDRNLGFAKACNQGARAAGGKYLVFLNNDTIPLKGWLNALVAEVEAHPEVGIVGSKLLYPDGTIQHAGVVFMRTLFSPYHIYRTAPADLPAANQRRNFQAVTAACMLIRRELFEEVNGFDEGFVNGFEDVDLCLKVREKGHHVIYQPRSVLHHLESQTSGRNAQDAHNSRYLQQRWAGHWWLGDEDLHYHTDGFKLTGGPEDVQFATQLQPMTDVRDRAAWAHVAATQAAALKHDWTGVRRELSLVQHWPDDPFVLSWGALVCEHIKEPGLQNAFRTRYLAMTDAPEERLALVRSLLAEKDLGAADQHLQKLLSLRPADAEVLLLQGILCMQREQYTEAERAFSSALRQGADRKKCLMGMGMASLGRAYAQGAWERFLQVLGEHPDDAEAVHWLLRAGTAQNRWEELSRQLRHYVSRNPGDLSARFALAGVLLRAEHIEAARQEHDAIQALAPNHDGLAELGHAIAGKETVLTMETTRS